MGQKEGDMLRGDLLANQKALSDLNVYAGTLRSRCVRFNKLVEIELLNDFSLFPLSYSWCILLSMFSMSASSGVGVRSERVPFPRITSPASCHLRFSKGRGVLGDATNLEMPRNICSRR